MTISEWVIFLAGGIGLIIGLIAMRGFIAIKSRRLLLLSLAFLSLAALMPIEAILFFHLSGSSSFNDYNIWIYLSEGIFLFSLLLLLIIYTNERRDEAVKITRDQWIVATVFILIGSIWLLVLSNIFLGGPLPQRALIDNIIYLTSFLAYVLIVLILVSLFALYKVMGSKRTLLTMFGFSCVWIGQALIFPGVNVVLLFILSYALLGNGWNLYLTSGLLMFIGYLAFLVWILRARSSNAR